MSKVLEIFLYKNKLNEKSLIDFLPKFSKTTIKYIINDLDINCTNTDKNQDINVDQGCKLYIFSDGNCRGNGKKNAKAGYSVFFTNDEKSQFFKFNKTKLITTNPTNNKAELSGIRCIFKTLNENQQLFNNKEIVICTDSQYSISCLTKWSDAWIKNGWINSKKEPVKNKELIQNILELQKNIFDIKVSFKHVFAHTKEPIDKTSLEYFYWLGNNTVDTSINKMLDLTN